MTNNTAYQPYRPIANIYTTVEEIMEFVEISGMPYKQHKVIGIACVILHQTGKLNV